MGLFKSIGKILGLGGVPGQVSAGQYNPKLTGQLASIRDVGLQDLQRQAAGKGPSLAKEALKAAQERSLAQQLAAAQAMPTRNVGALQRQLVAEQGRAGRELAQTGAIGRVQEQLGAQQQLMGLTESELQRQAGAQQAAMAANAKLAEARAAQEASVVGGLLGAGSSIGAAFASDEKVKENKAPAKKEINSFLDALSARQYNYKQKFDNDTSKKYGIMAQDLEKSKVGKSMVKEMGGVKHVDYGAGFGAILAAQAELNDRLKKLEGSSKPEKKKKEEKA